MIAIFILISLYGTFNALMDILQFRFYTSFFVGLNNQFWNPEISWKNKWKVDSIGNPIKKDGEMIERFLGSSTILVFITDGWHLMKAMQNTCLYGIVFCYIGWWAIVAIFIKGLFFNVIFNKFGNK